MEKCGESKGRAGGREGHRWDGRKMEEAQKDQSDLGWNNVEREGMRDGKGR